MEAAMTKKTETLPAEEAVATAAFPELGTGAGAGGLQDIDVLGDVRLEVTVELGRIPMKVRDLLALQEGTVVDLDRTAGAAVDVVVNGTLVARGDVVVVDDELGVRVAEVVGRRGTPPWAAAKGGSGRRGGPRAAGGGAG